MAGSTATVYLSTAESIMKEGSNSKAILSPPVEDRTEHEAPEGEGGASGYEFFF